MGITVGKITFGPQKSYVDDRVRAPTSYTLQVTGAVTDGYLCNCIGPQPGQTKCPCALRGESETGRRMVREGVTIDGVEYELVRKADKPIGIASTDSLDRALDAVEKL